MKTKHILIIAVSASALLLALPIARSGDVGFGISPESRDTASPPAPTTTTPDTTTTQYFKANEWNASLMASGSWTQSAANLDRYFGTDHSFGGTLAGKYFLNNNIGLGLSLSGYDVKNVAPSKFNVGPGDRRFIGDSLLTVTYRYPMGQFAPYVFAGGGFVFNGGNSVVKEPTGTPGKILRFEKAEHDVKLLGEVGAGLEYRLSQNWGILAEAAFDKIDRPQSNSFQLRTGINFAF